MSNPWGNIGAWAADAEQAEAEEREQQAAVEAAGSHISGDSQSYPSLREAAAAKPKKKKATPIPLAEFNTGNYGVPGRRDQLLETKGLTPDEMLRLPTRPKERSAEEMEQGRLGGGFRSYGRSGPSVGRRGDDSEGSWGGGGGGRRSNGGFDDERRGPPSRASDPDQPSRADEVDNWATGKKPVAFASTDSGRSERYGSLGGGGGSGSRADEVDNWATGKKPVQTRMSNFGSGFRDSAPDSDRWSRGVSRDGDRERPKLVLDPPRGGELASNEPAKPRASPFGEARPREEVLAAKGLDLKKLDSEKTSRPSSSQSSRQGSPPPEAAPKPRPKVNPFGDAKPREVLLQEKGKDWRKIDLELEHRSVDRPETEDEKRLKVEINRLKELMKGAEVNANEELAPGAAEERAALQEQILTKERDLETLICDLNKKVRFGQRAASDRPSSGAGRIASFPDRPPSQSGMLEEPRSMEFVERPRSRGSDVWTRSGDDRKSFQSGRERGFFANRDMDRSNSRERW